MHGRLTAPALALLALALLAAGPVPARAAEPVVDCIEIPTRAPNNPCVKFWYRVPSSYDPSRRERHRVLVLFGGRNADGRPEVSGKLGWTAWADLNGVFLVAPTLKDDAYWDPKAWSGRALLDALDALAAKFRVATRGLLFYGYSAGSQAANLFPAWRPGLCRAYASHACGVFHGPSAKMRGVAGLVTCGDADAARYALGRRFVSACRARGVPVVWRSFPNRPHDVPAASARLAREFLAHHHWAHPEDLGGAPVPSALGDLRRRHGLRPYPVFLYGHSAGGELAALLRERPPFPVAAWAVHGCGVYPEAFRADAPALVSCGVGDAGRLGLSRTFACRYREAGGLLVWKPTRGGHGPDAGALALARALFAAVASGAPCALWGEDDTRRVLPRARIDPEYANPLYTPAMAALWRGE